MPPVQTTYNERHRAGLPGLVANMETQNSVTRICEAVAGIGFGQPVVQGAGDKGALLPNQTAFAAVGAARAGNTGNGTITANPVVSAGVRAGVYTVIMDEPGTNVGHFRVEDPDGVLVGEGDVAVAFAGGGLAFTVADGATDFVAGDGFNITVTASAGGGAFRGISIRDITLVAKVGQTVDLYQQGDSMGVLTKGVIWVTAGATVAAGQQAYWNPANGRFTNSPAHYPLPNCSFDTAGVDAGLVKLRVSHF